MRNGTVPLHMSDEAETHLLSSRLFMIFGLVLIMATSAMAGNFDIRLEGGGVWFSRNDVRIPGDTGTRFDMLDLTGTGSDPYVRIYAIYNFNEKHALRLTFAPLEVAGTGWLNEDVTFRDDVFTTDSSVKGKYTFNTWRLTYRWSFYDHKRWRLGFGAALLVRDADITLEQQNKRQSKDDLGLVPLLHGYTKYRLNNRASIILDVEGAWSPMGRAVDAALTASYDFDSGWYIAAGYRILEGGADNDDVYTFAMLHYALATLGFRF
jgi:hypothetical protein